MFIIHYKAIFLSIAGLIFAGAIGAVTFLGLPLGIDFTGGTLIEARYEAGLPSKEVVSDRLDNIAIGNFSIRGAGEDEYIIRTRDLAPEERAAVTELLSINGEYPVSIERVTTIGPSLGTELTRKALVALGVLSLVIVLYIAYVFRKVSRPVPSFMYGIIVVLVLLHDIIVPAGFFALMGYFFGAEVDALFVVALLAILGYSVNDTIVVFDRVRENLKSVHDEERKEDFEITVGKSLKQTYVRSINTSLTTALTLLALFFLGATITENFALTLLVGVIAGTYSSLFVAAPLLVLFKKWWFKKSVSPQKVDQ